jgi:hypothetical protein
MMGLISLGVKQMGARSAGNPHAACDVEGAGNVAQSKALPARQSSTLHKCERWLKKHPKVHFHFIPTRSSWLNQIETWFSILQNQSLSGASFTTVVELQEHIDAFISTYNQTATPFAWTKKKVYQRRFKNRRITKL